MDGFVYDIEADALYLLSTKIWYIRFKSLDGSKTLSIHPFKQSKEKTQQQIQDWLDLFEDGCLVVGHNILGYDMWMLWRHLGFAPKVMKNGKDYFGNKRVQYIDTFVLSQYINPDSQSHSLEYLARGSEDEKMDYRTKLVEAGAMVGNEPKGHEFSFYHPLMDSYCDDDVDANIGVGKRLWVKAKEMYKDGWIHTSFKQMQKDYFLYSAQAYTGVKFNVEKAKALIERIDNEMGQIKSEVDPLLPPRPLKTSEEAFYRIPAKPFKKSGELSTIMEKWLIKHNAKLVDGYVHVHGLKVRMEAGKVLPVQLPMEIEDNIELKQYFLDSGWKPHEDFWNFKRGPDNKPVRDEKGKYIKTTPKIQNAGQLCPNLLKMDGEIPKKLVKFLSLRNRKGVVEGWLSNWRIEFDGRLSAEISGYAPTSRVKHRTVVNVPKADPKVLLGCEMRDLFEVPEGYWYCGTDAAALENRTLSHYTFKFDGGKFARMQTEGDPHSFNAFAFFPHLHDKFDINDQENKENPEFKTWRNKAKTGAYLLAFGGGAAKLASSLGLSKQDGQEAYDNYWKMNEGLGKLKESAEKYYSTKGMNKYIPGIDGRLISVRGKNVLLSCLGQGCGAVAMSYAACFMDSWLGEMYIDNLGRPYYLYEGKIVKRISMVHDEYSWEVEDGIENEISNLTVKAIIKAGEFLKLSLPLNGEGKVSFEGSWLHVH